MLRKIIKIDEKKCNGCGICATACHEGAIGVVNGKAKLLKDDYCDGLGDCLPACPTGAIAFEERETTPYSHKAVIEKNLDEGIHQASSHNSELDNWPVQIKLAAPQSTIYDNADVLIAASCTAFSYRNFHSDFIHRHVTLIGCPKLDMVDYSEKLAVIFRENNIRSIEVVRMEVPCCGGLEYAVKKAIVASGKTIPCLITIISVDGKIIS